MEGAISRTIFDRLGISGELALCWKGAPRLTGTREPGPYSRGALMAVEGGGPELVEGGGPEVVEGGEREEAGWAVDAE